MNIGDRIEWARIFYTHGKLSREHHRFLNAIDDPPTSGWQHGFIMRDEKRSTIFCPYSMKSWDVHNGCAEIELAVEPKEWRPQVVVALIRKNWEEGQRLGISHNLDVAAMVLKRLGQEVPTIVINKDGEADDRKRGGKDAADKLTKPVERSGKRGKFLDWFLQSEEPRSIRECMAEFGITRSNALSYLFMLNKDHGIGYLLIGDAASVILPGKATAKNVWAKGKK